VDVAAKVVEQMFRRAKRLFGVDDPRCFSQSFDQQPKVGRIAQGSGFSWEDELVLIEGLLEKVEELTLEDDAEGFDTEEEVFAGGDPAVLIERQSSFWEEAMEVEVVVELLIPGVQDEDKARGSLKMSLSKFQEGLGDSLEQEIEEDSFVYQEERVEYVA
jgi:hypothetical protein